MKKHIDDTNIQRLRDKFAGGEITRREFLAKMAAIGVAVSVPITLNSHWALAATPKKGGTLKIGIGHGSTSDSYDPATLANGFQTFMSRAINNTLTEIDPSNKLVPSQIGRAHV